MICPKCKEEGRKSIIRGGMGMVTAMYCPPYWDEEGTYHHHDANTHTSLYTCSNGHRITVTGSGKCPNCKWGHDNERITVEDESKNEGGWTTDGSGLIGLKDSSDE